MWHWLWRRTCFDAIPTPCPLYSPTPNTNRYLCTISYCISNAAKSMRATSPRTGWEPCPVRVHPAPQSHDRDVPLTNFFAVLCTSSILTELSSTLIIPSIFRRFGFFPVVCSTYLPGSSYFLEFYFITISGAPSWTNVVYVLRGTTLPLIELPISSKVAVSFGGFPFIPRDKLLTSIFPTFGND